jgi:fido (protein-threonine AMPylation protein)
MVSIKERKVRGKKYLYITATSSFKGEKKRFEKSLGPADSDPEELEHKKEFYTELFELKSILHKIYLEAKWKDFKYLPRFYSIYLSMIRNFYSQFLSDLYPSELEKYRDAQNVKYIHHTTAIEGNTLTLREAALVLEDGIAPKGKKLREIHEVENFKRVVRYLKSYKGDISLSMMRKLHSLIQRSIDDEQAGNFRRIGVGVVGSIFEPPPAIFVEEELKDLIKWYKENPDELHPFELAGIFHYRFVQIHPFIDGNGRMARELLNFILSRNGYPPLILEITDREDYLKRLQKADEGDPKPFLELLAIKMITDYEEVIMSFQKKALKDLATLNDEEMGEIFEMLVWFMNMMREFEVDIPPEARERITSIRRFFEMVKTPGVEGFSAEK